MVTRSLAFIWTILCVIYTAHLEAGRQAADKDCDREKHETAENDAQADVDAERDQTAVKQADYDCARNDMDE